MTGFTPDGVWLVSLIVTAGTGWVAGRWGKLRLLRPPVGSGSPEQCGTVAAKQDRCTGEVGAPGKEPIAHSETRRSAAIAGRCRHPFHGMPPVEEVRAEAAAIRHKAKIWKTHDLARYLNRAACLRQVDPIDVLTDYRAAIEGLECLDRPSETGSCANEEPIALSIGTRLDNQPSSSLTRV